MKTLTICILLALPSISAAGDEFVQFSNGATAWRTYNGHVYGYSGGVRTGDTGFNDVRTGERYEYTNPQESINTRTGRPVYLPPGAGDSDAGQGRE